MEKKDELLQPFVNQDFYQDLTSTYAQLVTQLAIGEDLPEGDLLKHCKEGTAALSYCPPTIEPASFKIAFQQVLELFIKFYPDDKDHLQDLQKNVVADTDEQLGDKLKLVFKGDEELTKVFQIPNSMDQELAELVLTYTFKPFLKAYSQYMMEKLPQKQWEQGYCPVCGHNAAMAILSKEKDGKRLLWCSVCESQWEYKRIGCPACKEDNPDNLGYFRVEEQDNGYRVNYCNKCKSYLKTYDEQKRISAKLDWFLEDKKTGHLDYLAIKEGFKPTE